MARLLAEVPDKEHKYLKMCCAQLGVTMRSFITAAIIEKVERQEDEWLMQDIEEAGEDNEESILYMDANGVKHDIYS